MFNYLYRDAGNYKTFGSVIFSNPSNLSIIEIETKIKSKLISSEFFDPIKFSIPMLNSATYDQELDHEWHEFESLEVTNESATDKRTIIAFLENL